MMTGNGGEENLAESQWKEKLSAEEYYILRESGTERPFTGDLLEEKRKGEFHCKGCSSPLFNSTAKYDSGSGWPSFFQPIEEERLLYLEDYTIPPMRTEVRCARCNCHLGHVFDDGPQPTGKRYCLNSIALNFNPSKPENKEL